MEKDYTRKMKISKTSFSWEEAILEAIRQLGGTATIVELYKVVPQIRTVPTGKDWKRIIRAFLKRLYKEKEILRKVGLGIYALPEATTKISIYEQIQRGENTAKIFRNIPDEQIHSYVEGMLVELGNINGYLTYTYDGNAIFNEKPLSALTTLENFPQFALPEIVDEAKRIDVIWFSRRMIPKHTFDVEKTPEFRRAFLRAYQLRDFRTAFYFTAFEKNRNRWEKIINLEPYDEVKHLFHFRSFEEVFQFYQIAIKLEEIRETFIVKIE